MAACTVPIPALYHHARYGCYECLGCTEIIEIPRWGWLVVNGHRCRVPVQGNPENLLLWLEMQQLDHEKCQMFNDVQKAKDAREFRKERDRLKLVGGRTPGRCGSGSATAGARTR
jgi:hypothetical protein